MDDRKVLEIMYRSRFFEEKIDWAFKKGLLYGTTHLSIGQEASHTGLALALEKGDWVVPTHRSHGISVALGSDLFSLFSEMLGSRYGEAKGLGGSMHLPDKERGNLGSSAVVGSGIPLALGTAFHQKRKNLDNISVAILGDGASSRGTLHESMNLASVWNLPVLFFLENNHYGMSASSDRMISTKSIASRAIGYSMKYNRVDGNDVEEVYNSVKEAREYIVNEHKPFFLEVNTYRQCGHSKSDRCLYRTKEEEKEWKEKDPILLFEKKSSIDSSSIKMKVKEEIDSAWDKAYLKKDDVLSEEEVLSYVYPPEEKREVFDIKTTHTSSYREAIREALDIILSSNLDYTLIGEDIAEYGGCFSVTGDLYKKYPEQVFETPVSEEAFMGLSTGAAMLGERPIVEIMYADFMTLASDALINHAAKAYFMSAGAFTCPLIIRTAFGGGTGHGPQHSASPENMFRNVPGLKIVAPADAFSAKALLLSASQENCPVLFLEHKALYNKISVVGDDTPYPIGKIRVEGKGKSLLFIGYSISYVMGKEALENMDVTFVDLMTIKPLDKEGILDIASSFNKILIAIDTPSEGSIGESIVALLSSLRGERKIRIVSSLSSPVPFSKALEKDVLLSPERIRKEALALIK